MTGLSDFGQAYPGHHPTVNRQTRLFPPAATHTGSAPVYHDVCAIIKITRVQANRAIAYVRPSANDRPPPHSPAAWNGITT